jgi:HEPN domain-containing protein
LSQEAERPAAQAWLAIARRDWQRLKLLLHAGDSAGAGFFLQQALEKFLKGYLVQRGWPLRKTHELDRLLDACRGYDPSLAGFRPLCERVSGYYVVERYPDAGEGPDVDQVESDVKEAGDLVQALFPPQAC